METPNLKFEHSPAESLADSFVSSPGTQYPSLFAGTMNPAEVLTPQSVVDSDVLFGTSKSAAPAAEASTPEKKPVKKRKSWGQQLPEPKTNLPPRKRAKTEDEKEQRRVERVLRNRRAAQSSRERKRLEVEALEAEKHRVEQLNRDLEIRLAEMEAKNLMLQRELEQFTGLRSTVSSPRHPEQFTQTPAPVTFSQELFCSQDAESSTASTTLPSSIDSHNVESIVRTVNPASLSPEIRPVVESSSNVSSSDMTQHPAAMLCDLQCQSDEQRPWKEASTMAAISQILAVNLWITWTSQAISNFLKPLHQIVSSLRTGSSLSPTPSILTTIIWLATTTASLTTSTLTTSSMVMTTSSRSKPQPMFNLRIRLLRRLLACSPHLARPLMDATVEAMRSVSEQLKLSGDWMMDARCAREHRRGDAGSSPTVETLMTLLWTIKVIDRENQQRSKESRARDGSTNDVAAEVRQACRELDAMFTHRRNLGDEAVGGNLEFPLSGAGGGGGIVGTISQKSLEDYWCQAFDQRDRN